MRTMLRLLGYGVWFALLLGGTAASTAEAASFTLYARGADFRFGNENVQIWGWTTNAMMGGPQLPGPILWVNDGDVVSITYVNDMMTPNEPNPYSGHTIHLHGLDVDQANDGVPETSFSVLPGQRYTYTFTADQAGTYMYHCHVHTVKHLEMGMYGALIVRAAGGANTAWTGGPAFDQQKVWVLSTIDPRYHPVNGDSTVFASYVPKYFLLNGKSGSNTNADTAITATVNQKVLVRLLNLGANPYRVSMGGLSFTVIASDGRPLPKAYSSTSLEISPGERYDLLLTLSKTGTWTPKVETLDVVTGAVLGSATSKITVQ